MLNYSWSKDYSVNDLVIDDHHKNLLKLFNKAYTLLVSDAPAEETDTLLKELASYAVFHFAEEEKRMIAANYDGYDDHVTEHKKFIEEVTTYKNNVASNSRELNEEIFIFLSSWLVNHIQKTDKLYMDKI